MALAPMAGSQPALTVHSFMRWSWIYWNLPDRKWTITTKADVVRETCRHPDRCHATWAPSDVPRKEQQNPELIRRLQGHDEEISYITPDALFPDEVNLASLSL
ncbi:Hypothetical protein NCS54_01239000 [Fusarium falciforme]|uniref:Hypothetical protein n=1 Tax=Fusarium falciforme TaxID=195108 RepID=UPI00230107CE|nr:Hypothetical protein NCS54_01239000 [Fusarium falciforme]WAO94790.1 Hypothetical protein NCS54_01239000 [Fusarium falciforme]